MSSCSASTMCLAVMLFAIRNVIANRSYFPPDQYWQVSPSLNYSDVLYAGWDQIKVDAEVLIYNGSKEGRTYAHHPQLYADGETVYLVHSSAVIDEDSMGQELWGSVSHDGGFTWTPSQTIGAMKRFGDTPLYSLMPNLFKLTPNRQRAIGGLAVIPYEDSIWGVGETTDFYCWGDIGSGTKGAGRIGRKMSTSGAPIGDPCWLKQNEYAYITLYNSTIYGTEYGMKLCEDAAGMNAFLAEPSNVPAWSAWLYNHELFAANGVNSMQENTHAVWIPGIQGGYWQRFWRDITAVNNTMSVWVEYSLDGRDWYPVREEQYGNAIYQTSIPDAKTKQFLGVLSDGTTRFLVSNPRNNTELIRQPLTIAMSRGVDDLAYRHVGVLRTNASANIVPDTRDYKNQGFSYPVAIQVGTKLVTAYSENKENIWVSVVDIADLPGED